MEYDVPETYAIIPSALEGTKMIWDFTRGINNLELMRLYSKNYPFLVKSPIDKVSKSARLN